MSRPKPLAGLRILDLTRLLPGPLCTLHLADLGADVVKIEDTGAGDYARILGPMVDDTAGLFLAVNRNKRALRLDLKQPAGREAFVRLAKDADAIVESFRPGVAERLGIDYEAVRAANPRIVYCAITGYGQSGPYRDRAGHDLNYIGYTGILDQTGGAGGDPVLSNFQTGDLAGGALTAAMGILAALLDAARTGQGRYVDVSMTDACLAHAVLPLAAHLGYGRTRPRGEDFLSGGLACYSVYRTADHRHMAVGALERKFWDLLCDTLERADLKPLHLEEREQEHVRAELQAIFAGGSQRHWAELFDRVDCCVTPVLTLEEAMENEQIHARGMVVESTQQDDCPRRQFAFPVRMSDFEFSVDRPAPAAGEHSSEILREAGYSPEEIDTLRSAGVI